MLARFYINLRFQSWLKKRESFECLFETILHNLKELEMNHISSIIGQNMYSLEKSQIIFSLYSLLIIYNDD